MRRNPNKRPLIERQIAGEIVAMKHRAMSLLGHDLQADEHVKYVLRSFLEDHPKRCATQRQAAIHEAAHFVAYEVFENGAWSARITGSAGGHAGGSGMVRPFDDQWDLVEEPTDIQMRNLAQIFLAGPWAEHFIAGGSALSSCGEVVAFQLLTAHAAKAIKVSAVACVEDTATKLTDFLEHYEPEIDLIADALVSRREIRRTDRSIKTIIASIHAKRIQTLQPATKHDDSWLKKEIGSLHATQYLHQEILKV